MKFDYKVTDVLTEDDLKKEGDFGWDLVSVYNKKMYFKKRKHQQGNGAYLAKHNSGQQFNKPRFPSDNAVPKYDHNHR